MATSAPRITAAKIKRVISAAIAGGLKPARVEVEGGKIVIYGADSMTNAECSPLDKWRRENGQG